MLSHRGGRVDRKAADDWPCGALEVGSFVRVSQTQVRRYSAAVGAFGAEISRRLLARFSVPVDVDLGNWEQHGFLIQPSSQPLEDPDMARRSSDQVRDLAQ